MAESRRRRAGFAARVPKWIRSRCGYDAMVATHGFHRSYGIPHWSPGMEFIQRVVRFGNRSAGGGPSHPNMSSRWVTVGIQAGGSAALHHEPGLHHEVDIGHPARSSRRYIPR